MKKGYNQQIVRVSIQLIMSKERKYNCNFWMQKSIMFYTKVRKDKQWRSFKCATRALEYTYPKGYVFFGQSKGYVFLGRSKGYILFLQVKGRHIVTYILKLIRRISFRYARGNLQSEPKKTRRQMWTWASISITDRKKDMCLSYVLALY